VLWLVVVVVVVVLWWVMGYGRELVVIDVYDVVVDGWLVRGHTFMTKMKQSPALIPTDNMIHFGFTINHSISFILILGIYFHVYFIQKN
jgi:hypothetical protein